jgi:hypothetical protein
MRFDFSKASPVAIGFVVAIGLWAIIDAIVTRRGFGDPDCTTGWKLTQKHAPGWWKAVSWCFWALILGLALFCLLLGWHSRD